MYSPEVIREANIYFFTRVGGGFAVIVVLAIVLEIVLGDTIGRWLER